MALIKIDGVNMPEPATFEVSYKDIDGQNTTRSESGFLQRDRVRSNVHTLALSWKALEGADAKTVLTAVSPAKFTISFPDPKTGNTVSVTAYSGDKTAKASYAVGGLRWDISFNNIEY